jgi:glycosyltransferase involved in cell wall biosynthesis
MRIGIDGRALTGRFTGDRTYWRNLLRALPALDPQVEFLVYSRTEIAPGELPEAPNLSCVVVPASNDRVWTLLALPRALRRDRADLVHVQYTAPPPALCPCPVVTTVHDISFRLYPNWFPARHRLLLNLTVPPSMRGAARVITDSTSSRRDILRTYRLPERKVVSIPLGVAEEFIAAGAQAGRMSTEQARQHVRERFGLEQPFVLAVGVLQPRKNLNMLAEAFGLMRRRTGLSHGLALVGKAGWGAGQEALRQAATRHGGMEAAQAVVATGYAPDADLPILYRASDVFTYPSLYEGFGIPPLEAMACGAPVIVSDAPPMPEVAGDAALIVGAQDVSGWADAMARVITDTALSADLSRRGPLHAAQFTWQATAQRTLEVYRECQIMSPP